MAQIGLSGHFAESTDRERMTKRTSMPLKLLYHPLSTYSRRVLVALLEKQIAYQPVIIDMASRKHRGPDYLALNPYGRVPTLDHDGFILYESTAILRYLETIHPNPALIPPGAQDRALVDMHMKVCDLQMSRHAGTIIFPKRFLPKERWDAASIANAKAEIEKHLGILERQLAGKSYLVAEQFTLADVCYLPFLQFLALMEIAPPPAVAAWADRLLARPSAKDTRPSV
jgi:glutathione S-transferase